MCVAVPMRLVEVDGQLGRVESGGLRVEVSLALLPEAAVGDHVIVHAGFALERLSPEEARETLELLAEMLSSADGADG